MPQTVEVRFKGIRRDFFLWPDDREPLRLRDPVVVPAERGHDLGRVQSAGAAADKKCGSCSSCEVGAQIKEGHAGGRVVEDSAPTEAQEDGVVPVELPVEVPDSAPPPASATPKLRAVLRRATTEDVHTSNELRRAEEDVRRQVVEKIRQHKLDMRVSDTEWQWDRTKLTVYFTAEKRVDFRALVRDLASMFRTRIELRQIGVRDEAARLGGVGRCGREYCCSTWLKDLSPISLALAKDQHLSLNPTQISGGCGRLLCCLKYEHEFYVAARKRFPREGKTLLTLQGSEKVVAVDIFRERVFLRGEGNASRIIPLVDLREEQEEADRRRSESGGVEAAQSVAPDRRPASPPRREDRAPAPRRPPREERPGPRADAPAPPAATPPAAPAPGAAPDRPGATPRRRRRRGRRGRGGGPAAPPPASES